MKQLFLRPVKEIPGYYERIEFLILQLFRKELYEPLLKEIDEPSSVLKNSLDDVVRAIMSGRVTFYRGQFKGRFNSLLSRELKSLGAVWDRTQGSWKIPQSKLPQSISAAIATSEGKFLSMMERVDKQLRNIVPEELADKINLKDAFDTTIYKVEKDLQKSAKNLTVFPELSESARDKIAEDYNNNMKLFIRDFTQKEVKKLRTTIEENVKEGIRQEHIVAEIQKSYGVTANKAKFLARQETSIMMSKFKEVRYKDAGITKYRWQCVHNPKDTSPKQNTPGNVRYWHAIHDGKIFSFDDPPQTDEHGNHKNPGMDFNCRCVAIPYLK